MFSNPYIRATSSIKSSSISISKRWLGGVTINTSPDSCLNSKARRLNTSATISFVNGMPMTLTARANRMLTGLRSGKANT